MKIKVCSASVKKWKLWFFLWNTRIDLHKVLPCATVLPCEVTFAAPERPLWKGIQRNSMHILWLQVQLAKILQGTPEEVCLKSFGNLSQLQETDCCWKVVRATSEIAPAKIRQDLGLTSMSQKKMNWSHVYCHNKFESDCTGNNMLRGTNAWFIAPCKNLFLHLLFTQACFLQLLWTYFHFWSS